MNYFQKLWKKLFAIFISAILDSVLVIITNQTMLKNALMHRAVRNSALTKKLTDEKNFGNFGIKYLPFLYPPSWIVF